MYMPSLTLEGKVAIVTGVRRGMGRAIALAFAEAGADAAVCDIVAEDGEMEAVAEEIKKLGRRSLAIQTDVTQKAQVDNLVKRVEDELGAIDILVNTVGGRRAPKGGVYRPGGLGQTPLLPAVPSIFEYSEEDWDWEIALNLKSCFLCCQAVGRGMVERKKGNIINIASDVGIRGFPGMPIYHAAKAGVIMLTKMVAYEFAFSNIRVNCIAPGATKDTHIGERWSSDPERLKQIESRIPLRQVAEAKDIASVALFLASDASRHITGDTILVDGGQMLT